MSLYSDQNEYHKKLVDFHRNESESATKYINTVVGLGYLAFFNLIARHDSRGDEFLWSLSILFMIVSAVAFVFFEIYKMIIWNLKLRSIEKALSTRNSQVKFESIQRANDRFQRRQFSIWIIILFITIFFGISSLGLITISICKTLIKSI